MFILYVVLAILIGCLIIRLNRDYVVLCFFCKRIKLSENAAKNKKLLVLPGKTIFGNTFDVIRPNAEKLFRYCRGNFANCKGKSYGQYFLLYTFWNVVNAEDAEAVMQNQSLITKNFLYKLMHPFLGQGLLTSTDKLWQSRRKLLTPTFHFNILHTFLEIFKEETQRFSTKLNKSDGSIIELRKVIPEVTLNNIIETALGVKLAEMAGNEKYRESMHAIEEILISNSFRPWMINQMIFRLFGEYKNMKKNLTVVHGFSNAIIQTKREEFRNRRNAKDDIDINIGRKQRYALLDTLLEAEANGLIDHQGICDEVDTFMFEGYDTTSTCLIFSLLNLALHPEIQQKCFEELHDFDDNSSLFDYNQLTYLECVLKEVLRMYPSVPYIGREVVEDTVVNDIVLPARTQISIHIYDILRDSRYFPEPNIFNPDRFLPENTTERPAFAFVPFSAGPRNCIGQKFALLEMKVVLAAVLKKFRLKPVTRIEDIKFGMGMILRTQQEIKVKIERRI